MASSRPRLLRLVQDSMLPPTYEISDTPTPASETSAFSDIGSPAMLTSSNSETPSAGNPAGADVICAVLPVEGSVIVILPVVPALMVMVALVVEATVCAVMLAPLPVEDSVKVGDPGVPGVQDVPMPVRVMTSPVEPDVT